MKIKHLLLPIICFAFFSCSDSDSNFPNFTFVFNGPLENAEEGGELPESIKSLINYYRFNEELDCYSKFYAPKVTLYRSDLDESVELGIPLSWAGNLRKELGLTSTDALELDYDVNAFSVPSLLTKEAGEVTVAFDATTKINLNLSSTEEEINMVRDNVSKNLCTNNFTDIAFYINHDFNNINTAIKEYTEDGVIEDLETENVEVTTADSEANIVQEETPMRHVEVITDSSNPCTTETIPEGLNLKQDIANIIDTEKSIIERQRLADKIWNKYFDKDAYVAKYLHVNDKNSEIWDIGDGKDYFTGRISILKSIYDINIIRLEFSKNNSKKITGIHVVECHNASTRL